MPNEQPAVSIFALLKEHGAKVGFGVLAAVLTWSFNYIQDVVSSVRALETARAVLSLKVDSLERRIDRNETIIDSLRFP